MKDSNNNYESTNTMASDPDNRLPRRGSIQGGVTLNDRYVVEKMLGQGGIGMVYLARDKQLHLRTVVIKVLLEETGRDKWFEKKFRQEIEALARINHPAVVGVFDAGEAPGRIPFIVMQFVKGVTLRTLIKPGGLEFCRTARIIKQVSQALTAAHEEGIIHCDLKPENIMLQDLGEGEEQVKVLDFGIAKVKHSQVPSGTEATRVAGTPHYMAPEQLMGEPTAPSDIYALGVIAYEMLTGQRPFEPSTPYKLLELQRQGVQVKPAELRAEIPQAAQNAILKALSYEPQQRFDRARDFGRELANALCPENLDDVASRPRIFLLSKPAAQPDTQLAQLIETQLQANCFNVLTSNQPTGTVEWAAELTRQVRTADAVIVLLSEESLKSEMLAFIVETAHEAAQRRYGRPRLLPVRAAFEGKLPDPLAVALAHQEGVSWQGPDDDDRLAQEMLRILCTPPKWEDFPASTQDAQNVIPFDPVYGAVPLGSRFYVVRPTDQQVYTALDHQESIVLIKGARQMGKSSLLARGLDRARESGARVVLTDFQKFNASHLDSVEALLLTLADLIADQLDLEVLPAAVWSIYRGPSMNFERYLKREVLSKINEPLVWGIDEVDRLIPYPSASEVFGLFRSWHNARALDPAAPWKRLTMMMTYKTEVHLFIPDINQSPFNVGIHVDLDDFTMKQVIELNSVYGSPLKDGQHLERFYKLMGGHPYLVQKGLRELATSMMSLDRFEKIADRDDGPFADHLHGILFQLGDDKELKDGLLKVLSGASLLDHKLFLRLRSAGFIAGAIAKEARPRSLLYECYLKRHLSLK